MISYDEELLEARRKAAEENPQMNYAAWARYYSDSEGLTEYELSILKDSISEHRRKYVNLYQR